MSKLAELFEKRFDSVEVGDDGVSLICAECGAAFAIPSPMDFLDHVDDMAHANEIMDLIARVLEHLDQCQQRAGG